MDLPKLIGEQCRVLYLPAENSQKVQGIAGSGKSVTAAYRAIWLSLIFPNEKILLLTCNKEISNWFASVIGNDHPNIEISTIYSYCNDKLNTYYPKDKSLYIDAVNHNKKSGVSRIKATTSREERETLKEATKQVSASYPNDDFWNKENLAELILREIYRIEDNHLTSITMYQRDSLNKEYDAELTDNQKALIFEIFQTFHSLLISKYGKYFGFHDIYWFVQDLNIPEEEKDKYIIIDEFQDVSPAMFYALSNLAKSDSVWNVFGDPSQNLFGQGLAWKYLDSLKNNVTEYSLVKNYRNSYEIESLAKSLLENDFFNNADESESSPKPSQDKRRCGKPQAYSTNYQNGKWRKDLKEHISNENCAIICLNPKDTRKVMDDLSNDGINTYTSVDKIQDNSVYVGSINRIKGLEFDDIILYGIDTGTSDMRSSIQDPEDSTLDFEKMTKSELAEMVERMYVSITRAKNHLTLLYKKKFPNVLFPDTNLINQEANDNEWIR